MARFSWRDWKPEKFQKEAGGLPTEPTKHPEKFQKEAGGVPTEPTKHGSDGFVGTPHPVSENFFDGTLSARVGDGGSSVTAGQPEHFQKEAGYVPSKPTEPGIDGSEAPPPAPFENFFGTPAEAVALLNRIQARFWIDETGAGYIGVWSFLDGREVRAAAALICPGVPVIHLERPEVPMHLKWMSEKIARFAGAWGMGRIQ